MSKLWFCALTAILRPGDTSEMVMELRIHSHTLHKSFHKSAKKEIDNNVLPNI